MPKVANTFSFLTTLGLCFLIYQMRALREAICKSYFQGLMILNLSKLCIITVGMGAVPTPGKGLQVPQSTHSEGP